MTNIKRETIHIALLDLYEGAPNEGMRCVRELIAQWSLLHKLTVTLDEFDVRQQQSIPTLEYDLYISSGGPGSPLESEGAEWENNYFNWIKSVEEWNASPLNFPKKHIFFICHSFQLAARYFGIGLVCKRKSTAFGVFPVHMLQKGSEEAIFKGLKDPFYSVDSRDYQVIEPNHAKLKAMGGSILAIEKNRPHVPFERAVMSVRFNQYFVGTQFHPEADALGMAMYLQRADKKNTVIDNHGEDKWKSMVEQLQDPEKIRWTHDHILPNFLTLASKEIVSKPI
jgi:GMP synthase-like glutamine amidotransferase